jgi:ribosomal protein L33
MHSYRVKEAVWLLIIVIGAIIALTGCSSAPKGPAKPYCYTAQEIRTKNKETVSSETLLRCTDDPIEKVTIKRAGVATNCGLYNYTVTLNGRPTQQRGLACEKFDGTWEIIPNYQHR